MITGYVTQVNVNKLLDMLNLGVLSHSKLKRLASCFRNVL